jgi:hypothetical protein
MMGITYDGLFLSAEPEKFRNMRVALQPMLVGGALTTLKNISQWEGLSHILWKIKNVPNHQPV